jgi:GntR family transcriptional regulator
MVNRINPSPIRYRVKKEIIDYLIQHGYEVGDKIPTEQEFVDILGITRFSLREALSLLEVDRIVSTKHGIGRFLISKPSDINIDITILQSVPDLLKGFNIESVDKILSVQECESTGEISRYLEIDDGTPVISIERVRQAKNIPIIYSIDTFPKHVLPGHWKQQDFIGSLFSYLENNCKIDLAYSNATIRGALLPEGDFQKIVDSSSLWILMEQCIYSRDGTPIIYSQDYHSDHIVFHVRRYKP